MSYGTSYEENSWGDDDPRTPSSTQYMGGTPRSRQHQGHGTPVMTPVLTPVGAFVSPIGGMFDNVGALHSPSLASHFHRKGTPVAGSGAISFGFIILLLLLLLFIVVIIILLVFFGGHFLPFCFFQLFTPPPPPPSRYPYHLPRPSLWLHRR